MRFLIFPGQNVIHVKIVQKLFLVGFFLFIEWDIAADRITPCLVLHLDSPLDILHPLRPASYAAGYGTD